jgi:hypothetical protein
MWEQLVKYGGPIAIVYVVFHISWTVLSRLFPGETKKAIAWFFNFLSSLGLNLFAKRGVKLEIEGAVSSASRGVLGKVKGLEPKDLVVKWVGKGGISASSVLSKGKVIVRIRPLTRDSLKLLAFLYAIVTKRKKTQVPLYFKGRDVSILVVLVEDKPLENYQEALRIGFKQRCDVIYVCALGARTERALQLLNLYRNNDRLEKSFWGTFYIRNEDGSKIRAVCASLKLAVRKKVEKSENENHDDSHTEHSTAS